MIADRWGVSPKKFCCAVALLRPISTLFQPLNPFLFSCLIARQYSLSPHSSFKLHLIFFPPFFPSFLFFDVLPNFLFSYLHVPRYVAG